MATYFSDAPEVQGWLEQFKQEDLPTVRLLLDSLSLVSRDETAQVLEKTLRQFVARTDVPAPVSLVAVRETLGGEDSYFPLADEREKPILVGSGDYPGSEALIGSLLRTVARSDKSTFLNHSSLAQLRGKRCRSVVFVEDIIGSGDRLRKFVDLYTRHPTIKSWLSLGYIRIYVVAYASTDEGEERSERLPKVTRFAAARQCPSFNNVPWSLEQKERVEFLCYRKRPLGKEWALGYRKTGGLLVFENSVPNNLPAILWGSGKGRRVWKPLFPNKAVPENLTQYFGHAPAPGQLAARLRSLGQKRLAEGRWLDTADPQERKMILVLSAVRKSRNMKALRNITGLTLPELNRTISKCEKYELLNASKRITERGYLELQRARRIKRKSEIKVAKPKPFYYPESLRRV